jgi:hypothetical protein
LTITSVILYANSTSGSAIIVNGVVSVDSSSTLVVQLTAPLPDGSVIPVLHADYIEGNISSVSVFDDPTRGHCARVSGEPMQTLTSMAVLLCVLH